MDYVCVFPIINLFPYIFMKDFAGKCFFVAKKNPTAPLEFRRD